MQTVKVRKYVLSFVGVFLFLFVWNYTNHFADPGYGLDMSWVLSLSWMRQGDQFLWGRDYFFTYGPLYFLHTWDTALYLNRSQYLFEQVMINLVYNVVYSSLFVLFYKNMRQIKESYLRWGMVLLLSMSLLAIEGSFTNSAALLAVLLTYEIHKYLISSKSQINTTFLTATNSIIALLMAVVQFVKFSYFYISIAILIILFVNYLIHKRKYLAISFVVSYLLLTVIIWLLAGQKIQYLLSNIYYSLQISNGYTEAMQKMFLQNHNFQHFIFGSVFVLAYIVMLAYLFTKSKTAAVSAFLITPLIFLEFKEAFVRADDHTAGFNGAIVLSLCYVICIAVNFPDALNKFKHHLRNGIMLLLLLMTLPNLNSSIMPKNTMLQDYNLLKNADSYSNVRENGKSQLRSSYASLSDLSDNISEVETVDIFPTEISALWGYGWNWMPRPVSQSYSDYTAKLDILTAEHFTSSNAPQKIIWQNGTIDGRYALFDEPGTFRTVLTNYDVLKSDDSKLLLQQRETMQEELQIQELGTQSVTVGEAVNIPKQDSAYVFMRVNWKPTLLGKAANFLFKTPNNDVTLTLNNGERHEYRFIRSPAENGLLVSHFVGGNREAAKLFKGELLPNIDTVTIKGNSAFYKNQFDVSFFAVPLEQLDRVNNFNKIEVKFTDDVPAGVYQLFYAVDNAFSGDQMTTIAVKSPTKSLLFPIPQDDNTDSWRLDFPSELTESYRIESIKNITQNWNLFTPVNGNQIRYQQTENNLIVTPQLSVPHDPFIVFTFNK